MQSVVVCIVLAMSSIFKSESLSPSLNVVGSATLSNGITTSHASDPFMEIDTKYAVRKFFPNPTFNQIYFETVANALDAEASEITILISTDAQRSPEHLEITITDNGKGFTDDRFGRFSRLTEPVDAFHKGLGRLVYLHYFSRVNVTSVFDGKKRVFTFSEKFSGRSNNSAASKSDKRETVLRFSGFQGERLKAYDDVRPSALKDKLLKHFLPYLDNRKRAQKDFKITIELKTLGETEQLFPGSQTITMADVPDFQCKTIHDNSIHAFADIDMRYVLERDAADRLQLTAASIDGRTIPINLLQPTAIPLNCSAIFLFESEMFTASDSARQRWTLPERVLESDVLRVLRREMSAVLNENLEEIEQKNRTTRKVFEERYPHLTGYFEADTVGIIDKDEAIDFAQRRFFREQKEVLESNSLDDATFEKSLEVSSRTLTAYVLYRELIIKRLNQITEHDREDSIHNLIVPRYRTFHSDGLLDGIYNNNAWILDDKFMSFRTILSERSMQELISAITLSEDAVEDEGRPDISMIFSADPNGSEKVDVVVVEIKRRRTDDKENAYASVQLVKRAQKLADHCPNIQRVWYFGIVHIDDEFGQFLRNTRWTPLFSKGQVFYFDFQVNGAGGVPVPTPTYLLSYDALIDDAAARNHTFLEILKHDIRKAANLKNGNRATALTERDRITSQLDQ
jgi:histidine kinase/DNA gyrase B/HSP90-like ATPase